MAASHWIFGIRQIIIFCYGREIKSYGNRNLTMFLWQLQYSINIMFLQVVPILRIVKRIFLDR